MKENPKDRGVVDSIAKLRQIRYMTKGAGANSVRVPKPPSPKPPSIDKLRAVVAAIPKSKPKKKSRKGRR